MGRGLRLKNKADVEAMLGRNKKKSRYGNVQKPVCDGIKFDSQAELDRYNDLKLMERGGVIRDLKVHPRYPITIKGVEVRVKSKRYSKRGRHLTYEADFEYYDVEQGRTRIEDVKMRSGHRTETYKIKVALMAAMGLHVEEV